MTAKMGRKRRSTNGRTTGSARRGANLRRALVGKECGLREPLLDERIQRLTPDQVRDLEEIWRRGGRWFPPQDGEDLAAELVA